MIDLIKRIIFLLVLASMFSLEAVAMNTESTGYLLYAGSSRFVTQGGNYYLVKSSSPINYYIPTKTAAEWAAFQANLPANITITPYSALRDCQSYFDIGITTDGTFTIDPDGSGPMASYPVYCDMVAGEGGWTLAFNQLKSAGYFANAEDALLKNDTAPTSSLYSNLGRLEDFRNQGYFTFKINFTGSTLVNIWSQSSNPTHDVDVTNYTPIDIEATGELWGGLELTKGVHGPQSNGSFLDGSVNSGTWWYSIGTYADYSGGMPGPNSIIVSHTQLWVKRYPRTSCMDIQYHSSGPSGMYTIDPDGPGGVNPFKVYCDMDSDGGGWTLAYANSASATLPVKQSFDWYIANVPGIDYSTYAFASSELSGMIDYKKFPTTTEIMARDIGNWGAGFSSISFESNSTFESMMDNTLVPGTSTCTSLPNGESFEFRNSNHIKYSYDRMQSTGVNIGWGDCDGGLDQTSASDVENHPRDWIYSRNATADNTRVRGVGGFNSGDVNVVARYFIRGKVHYRSCSDLLDADPELVSGTYTVYPDGATAASVYCDFSDSLKTKLIAHWRLDEDTSIPGKARDYGPYRYHGDIYGPTFTSGPFGETNGALNFTNTSYHKVVINHPYNNDTDFTSSAWIYPTGMNGFKVIVGSAYGNNIDAAMILSNDRLCFHDYGTMSSDVSKCPATTDIVLNQWQHVAMTYNAGTIKLFHNGNLIHTDTFVKTNRNTAVFIGGTSSNSYSGDRFFTGKISNVMIFDRSLSDAEVGLLKNVDKFNMPYAKDCEAYKRGAAVFGAGAIGDGYYTINNYETAGQDSKRVFCKMNVGMSGWTRIFRHKYSSGLFATAGEAINYNQELPTSFKYSIIDSIPDHNRFGKYQFMLNYPTLGKKQVWLQSTNPTDDVNVAGYEGIDIVSLSNYWGGLELGNGTHATTNGGGSLLDGSVNHSNWFYSVGAAQTWGTPVGFPASDTIAGSGVGAPEVELYVREAQIYKSCKDILDNGRSNGDGEYYVDPDGSGGDNPFKVYCDMTNDGGGWTMAFSCFPYGTSCYDAAPIGSDIPRPTDTDTTKFSDVRIRALLDSGLKQTRTQWWHISKVSAAVWAAGSLTNNDTMYNEFEDTSLWSSDLASPDARFKRKLGPAGSWTGWIVSGSTTGCSGAVGGWSNYYEQSCSRSWIASCEGGPAINHACATAADMADKLLIWIK